jgi:ElaB/YqjD/DUF883 family membrane-anchored ribosome-binding protein
MATLTYKKVDLIEGLKRERDKIVSAHGSESAKAVESIIKEAERHIKEYQEDIEKVKNGKRPKLYYGVRLDDKPNTSSIDAQIRRLEMAAEDVLKLTDKQADEILRYL